MTTAELAKVLKNLSIRYPKAFEEPEAVRVWREEMEMRTDAEFVLAQIPHYSRRFQHLYLPEFLQFLRDADVLNRDQTRLAAERKARAQRFAQDARSREDAEARARRDEWERIDAMIAKVGDEELNELARVAIEDANRAGKLGAAGVALLIHKLPQARNSKAIKALVYPILVQPELIR